MKFQKISPWIIALCLIVTGCASSRSGSVYSREQAQQSLSVYYGTILEVRPVFIEGTKSPAGTIMGGVTGAAIGNTIGGGTGRAVATVIGGVVGALAGSAIEEEVTGRNGVEITVELDNGQIMAVVQEVDDQYAVGDRIRILKSADGTTRVRQ